jgi:hypothetical protein
MTDTGTGLGPAPPPRALSPFEKRVRKWVLANRGVLTQVARAHAVSPQYVQQIAYGRSTARKGNAVEVELARLGWPGKVTPA